MTTKMVYRFLLINVFLQHALPSIAEQCLDPTVTIEYVNSCPESATAWQKASEKKNCSAYEKACEENTSFKYHCLVNAYWNATLEICAAEVSIVGHYCPEYNEYGNLIQEHHGTVCKACPFYYYSTEIYKYPCCFQHRNVEDMNATPLTTTYAESTSTHSAFESTTNSIFIIEPTSTASTSFYRSDGCCSNSFKDKITGTCKPCWIGYVGKNCSQKCKYPRYGAKCEYLCNCEKDMCDFSKGCLENVTDSIFSWTGSTALGVTNHTNIVTENGFKTILENPIIYGIISVGILTVILSSVYCAIRLRDCIFHVSSPI
ncbi:uncharacterized protein LOC125661723 isoform X2 [Ostrea edulis]|uniref:uncharacterized protein LOC125661723 isoform X2 n=1 Tax=Ostrea edulis TaxID=37623 RepID=UPI0024AFFAC4|nr:uncharacterized protein LOC125661723 isoform X2 [Ostrea edulis]